MAKVLIYTPNSKQVSTIVEDVKQPWLLCIESRLRFDTAPGKNSMSESPVAAAAKSLQSCLTLCDPIDGSPPGFPVPGILQARTLEWVAISFSNA